jgi:hypothetical protein
MSDQPQESDKVVPSATLEASVSVPVQNQYQEAPDGQDADTHDKSEYPEHFTPHQLKRLDRWQPSHRGMLQRAWAGKCSPRAAIKLQCLDCCGEDVKAVRECEDRCCPLWRFRPYQGKGLDSTTETAQGSSDPMVTLGAAEDA